MLLVDGARQVGKTYLIDAFCKEHFSNYISINLGLTLKAIASFERASSVEDFLLVVSSYANKPLVSGDTVVFIDKLQLAPQIDFIAMAKGFALDGRYRFIFSGSLLSVSEFKIALDPIGYLYEETMYPLDFEEFMWANSVQEEVISKAKECFKERKAVPDFIHESFMNLFYVYLMVGGMPEVVASYAETKDLAVAHEKQSVIASIYKKDITRYADVALRPYVNLTYDLIPSELWSKSKRFTLGKVAKDYALSRIDNDFLWLADAGVAIPVYNAREPKEPLLLSKNSRLMKLFSNDVGMLCFRLLDTGIAQAILSHQKDINFGGIFENAAAQELHAHGFGDDRLFYSASKKQGEVDFLISYKGKIMPIEIKSGKDYKRHVALDNLFANEDYGIEEAFVFGDFNLQSYARKTYFPIYMIGELDRLG